MDLNETDINILRHNLTEMVSRLNHVSGFVLLVLLFFAMPGSGMDMKQCRGIDLDLVEDHVMHVNECLKAAGDGIKEVYDLDADKMPCFGKCVFSKTGLIDEAGKPHKDKIKALIHDKMPTAVHDDLNKRMTTCLAPETIDIIDPKDESCATYVPMFMCIHVAFLEECAQ